MAFKSFWKKNILKRTSVVKQIDASGGAFFYRDTISFITEINLKAAQPE